MISWSQVGAMCIGGLTICFLLYLFKDDKVKEIQPEPIKLYDGVECKQDVEVIRLLNQIVTSTPLNVRNNNPINIRYSKYNNWVGQDWQYKGEFVKFISPDDGIKASIKVIKANIQSTKSVKEFVNRIAVDGDANSLHIRRYIKHLEANLGYKGKIRLHDTTKVLELMVFAEGGEVADSYFRKYYKCEG